MNLTFASCKHALQQMDDYLDGELLLSDMAAVSLHLRICHACKKKFAFERQFTDELRGRMLFEMRLEERALTDMSARVLCALSALDDGDEPRKESPNASGAQEHFNHV